MTRDQIIQSLNAEPFRPFVIKTTGGRKFRVDHPELMVLSPGGRTAYIFVSEDAAAIVDVLMIESINFRSNGKRRRRSA